MSTTKEIGEGRFAVQVSARMGADEATIYLHAARNVSAREVSAAIYELAAEVERVCAEHKSHSVVLVSTQTRSITLAGLGLDKVRDGGEGYLREAASRHGLTA